MEDRAIILVTLLGLGIVAQWFAWRVRIPSILPLLVFGFGVGNLGILGVETDDLFGEELLFSVVSLSVGVILFEGGLSLKFNELHDTAQAVFRLVTLGVLVTWGLTTVAAWWILNFTWPMAALLGAILVVSGPTVIVPILRQVQPTRRFGGAAKWEGIVNDPVGAVLAVLVFQAVLAGEATSFLPEALKLLGLAIVVGLVAGVAVFLLILELLRRHWIPDYLQNGFILAMVVISFAISNLLAHESGLIAVTLLGILLANQKTVSIRHIIEFKENLRTLLISSLFIVLSSRLSLADLTSVGAPGVAFLAVLLVVVRPVTVAISTFRTKLTGRERIVLGWLAPRGIVAAAVSSLFAIELIQSADVSPMTKQQAELLAPVVFLVIVGTVAVYGLTVGPLARWLHLAAPNPQGIIFAGAGPFVRQLAKTVQAEEFPVLLVDTNYRNLSAARMLGLPTCDASILSEYVLEEVELSGIGRLLAMTQNDEVNSLAGREFIEQFGRAGVYQVSPEASNTERREKISQHHQARLLFAPDITVNELNACVAEGGTIKKTKLTEEFGLDDFREMYGKQALMLCVLDGNSLLINTIDQPLKPKVGQTLICLVQSKPEVNEAAQSEVNNKDQPAT
ncbi:MAG: cation:proton antiporter [Pirellulales bacterium]|nr:cation:proton antiporter [Pirellulales bacterium]